MKRLLNPVEQPARGADGREQIGDPVSPYLRSDEAARFLRFSSARLFREWAVRHAVPTARIGRRLLFDRRVLDAYARGESWTKRRSA